MQDKARGFVQLHLLPCRSLFQPVLFHHLSFFVTFPILLTPWTNKFSPLLPSGAVNDVVFSP